MYSGFYTIFSTHSQNFSHSSFTVFISSLIFTLILLSDHEYIKILLFSFCRICFILYHLKNIIFFVSLSDCSDEWLPTVSRGKSQVYRVSQNELSFLFSESWEHRQTKFIIGWLAGWLAGWFVCFVGFSALFHMKAFFCLLFFQKDEPILSVNNIGYGYAKSIQEPSLSELEVFQESS